MPSRRRATCVSRISTGAPLSRPRPQNRTDVTAWSPTTKSSSISTWRVEVDADRVLVLVELRGIGRSSGVEVAMTVADLHTLRQGRIVQVTGYPDHREALKAVDLPE